MKDMKVIFRTEIKKKLYMVKTCLSLGPTLDQYIFIYFQMTLSFLFPNNFVTVRMTTL